MRHVQLRAFHYVAICGGFTRAAEELGLTQPAISDQVRRLEADYDVLLFDRSRRQVMLTDTGRALLQVTRRLFETEKQAAELLSETRALRTGRLRMIADCANHVVPILADFRCRFPKIEIAIDSGNSEDVAAALHSYEADIGVIGDVPDSRAFYHLSLGSTPLVGIVSNHHRLASRSDITLDELAKADLVMRENGSMTRRMFEAELEQRNMSLPVPVVEAEGREAVRDIVATGTGLGLVSEAEFGHDRRVVPLRIRDANIMMEESLICMRERTESKVIREFLRIARAQQGTPAE